MAPVAIVFVCWLMISGTWHFEFSIPLVIKMCLFYDIQEKNQKIAVQATATNDM